MLQRRLKAQVVAVEQEAAEAVVAELALALVQAPVRAALVAEVREPVRAAAAIRRQLQPVRARRAAQVRQIPEQR